MKRTMCVWCAPLALALAAGVVQAADPVPPGPWGFQSTVGLNFNQSSYSQNWNGGEDGSIVWALQGDLVAERQFNVKYNLKNQLQLAFGQTTDQVTDAQGQRRWDSPDKTTDLILFESTSRFTLQRYADPYLAFRLDSQFRDESDPLGPITLNPIRLQETAGLARVFEKTETRELISRFGFGFRQVFSQSFTDPLTLDKERNFSNDGGLEWQTTMTRPVLEDKVVYKGNLLVFYPVFFSESGDLEAFDALAAAADPTHSSVADYWKTADVNFQNLFTAKITSYLSVNLFAQFIYDKFDAAANVDPSKTLAEQQAEVSANTRLAGQFKQTLALALSYSLF